MLLFSDKWKTFIDPSVVQPYEEKNAHELQVGDILVFPTYPYAVLTRKCIAYARIMRIIPEEGDRTLAVYTDLWYGSGMMHETPTFLLYPEKEKLEKVLIKSEALLAHEARSAELTEKAKMSVAAHVELLIHEEHYKEGDKVVVTAPSSESYEVLRVDYYNHIDKSLTSRPDWFHSNLLNVMQILRAAGWWHECRHFRQQDPFREGELWMTVFSAQQEEGEEVSSHA